MSDPEVPQPEQPHVDDVLDSAKAGLADAEAAAAAAGQDRPVEDADAAAFAEAETAFPGTFSTPASDAEPSET
ncbi:MAG: ABC transporter, partial [Microbacterium sp.]